MMTVQYKKGGNRLAAIETATAVMKIAVKIAVPTRYPRFIDMVTASPPVSPSVVARILTIQNARVTSGSLLLWFSVTSRMALFLIGKRQGQSTRILRGGTQDSLACPAATQRLARGYYS